MSGKFPNFVELLPSCQSSSQNEHFVSIIKHLLNVFRSALFHTKTRICLKYFINDCGSNIQIK